MDRAPPTGFMETWARIAQPHRLRLLASEPFPAGTCFRSAYHVHTFAAGIGYNTNPGGPRRRSAGVQGVVRGCAGVRRSFLAPASAPPATTPLPPPSPALPHTHRSSHLPSLPPPLPPALLPTSPPATTVCESPVVTGLSHWMRQLYGQADPSVRYPLLSPMDATWATAGPAAAAAGLQVRAWLTGVGSGRVARYAGVCTGCVTAWVGCWKRRCWVEVGPDRAGWGGAWVHAEPLGPPGWVVGK